MKIRNRILAVFLTAAIIFSSIPINASSEEDEVFAEDESVSTETIETTEETSSDESDGDETVFGDSSEQSTEETPAEEIPAEDPVGESNEEIGAEWFEVQLSLVEPRVPLDELETLAGLAGVTASIDKVEKKITVDDGGLILLSNTSEDLKDYTIFLSGLSGGYADLTRTITIEGVSYSFKGLGSDTTPFSGAIESQDTSYGVIVNVPFFNYVNVSKVHLTNLQTLKIKRRNTTTALLANVMRGESNDTWSSLAIQAEKDSSTDGGTTIEYLPGELISTMEAGASLSLGTVTYQDGAEVSPDSDNAGLLCNTMNANSCLSVQQLTVAENVTITATNGSAGGLVGLMNSGASLTVKTIKDDADTSVTIGSNFTITGQNAGGLIGSGTDVNLSKASVTIDGANVKGGSAAGGLIGSYTTSGAEGCFASYDGSGTSTLKVNNVNLETTADGKYAGGLFGILDLKNDYTISDASVTSSIAGSKAYYGGLVGQVKGDPADSLRALTIGGTSSPNTTTTVNLNGYGGAVAVIGNDNTSPAYVQISNTFEPTFSGVDKSGCFGGVAAYLKSDSVLELNATFTTSECTNIPKGGGVLGDAASGSTLCLSGTTNLSSIQFNSTNVSNANVANTMGQIVGTQESALIYAKSDWKLIRQSTAQELDDIGTYGEVIRLGGNMGMDVPSDTSGLSEDLIFQNSSTHKTEFLDSAKNALSGDTFTITSADQLALLAIEEQTKCAFNILGTSGSDYYFKSNPNKNITLSENISLEHTGITGLQRDVAVDYAYTGTLDGGDHTLTIAAGEIYGYRGTVETAASRDTAGSGQIHGHSQVGFFSQANGTIQDLTVDGEMNLRFRTKTSDTSKTYLAGGLAAKNTNTSSYTNVTTFVNIQYQGTTSGSIGGLVGLGTALTLTNCTSSATIDAGNSAVYAGGLIGQYTGAMLSVSGTTLNGKMTATGANHARLGGLVSRIAKGSYDKVSVTLTDITVNGQTITGENITGSTVNGKQVPASCGGLLGYEWNNTSVTFGKKDSHSNGLTVTKNSSVTVDGTTETAGLVYAATGYWQVNDIQLQNLTVTSGNGDLGLLICRGWRRDIPTIAGTTTKPYLLYLEETANNAYQIGTVSVSNESGYFDEWVVYTCESKETIMNNGNSVISIATASGNKVEGERVGVDPSADNCTSYQNRTNYGKTATANPNARYYYDLDIVRAAAQSATQNSLVNTPGELVLWAVWRYAEKTGGEKSNIEVYFSTSDIGGASMTGDGNLIDLTGYAYYPITVDGFDLTVTKITVKFANQKIEAAEVLTGDNLDSLNRTTIGTTDSHTQHYLMHSGLLLNYQNSTGTENKTLTVSNVTFQGTIGKGPNGGSGALICGQLGGYTHATSPKYANLTINGVTLDDVSVNAVKNADGYAPLLVNCVGSYSSLSAQNVSTSDYSGVTSTNNPAATSLIGNVGSDTATNITLAFSNNIALDGKKENSIFSHATLLESFRYQSGGSGYYHFNVNETCTYGQEINTSTEYPGMQLWYYDDQSQEVNDNGNKDFSTNYLPYVCQPYDGDEKFHELEINVKSPDLIKGCGTYDDPYLIETPGQLMRAADFINGNDPQTGWKVNKVTNQDVIKTDAEDNHTTYEVGKTGWDAAAMRTYMRGAYYKIQDNLTLSSFSGFGSDTYPFVGVIDGNNTTVSIKNAGSGFINVSYGSVVRNLTIQYIGNKTLTDRRPTGETGDNSKKVYADSYFGGIIGTVKGGDSLIDNVRVTFDNEFTITTSYDLQCAGGFVGLIQGGGVVFRNMGDTTRNPGYTKQSDKYYVDKYIGRVLDGYAINEVEDSVTDASVTFAAGTNTDDTPKNYSIPNISSTGNIAWDNGTITIGNAQQMIIFTDIINSGAASNGSATAYSDGAKTRNAYYSKIGNVSDAYDIEFVVSRKDDAGVGMDNYPYLITKYVTEDKDSFWGACKKDIDISMTFTSTPIDLSPYGNGYRGIGGRYQCTASQKLDNNKTVGDLTLNTPKIKTVTGNGVSLHVENNIKEYRADNFYANAVGGLFNVLRHNGVNIDNINIYGTVKVSSDFGKDTDKEEFYLQRAPVGGVIGRDYDITVGKSLVTMTGVSFGVSATPSIVYGECVSGGFVGSSGSKANPVFDAASNNDSMLHLTNCSYQNVTVTGGMCAGGFVGAAVNNQGNYITTGGYENDANYRLVIEWTEEKQVILGNPATFQMLFNQSVDSANGIGGLIGFSSVNFSVEGKEGFEPVLQRVNVYGSTGTSKKGRVGALVGFVSNSSNTKPYAIRNISVKNCIIGKDSSNDDNAGGIVGTWYSTGNINIENCMIADTTLKSRTTGGVLGYGSRGTVYANNITLSALTLNYVTSNVGGLGGEVTSTFYGQNVLMQNMTYEKPDSSGRFFGTGTNARLLGVTIQPGKDEQGKDKPLPQKDIFNRTYPTDYGTTNYVIYADYSNTVTTPADIATKPSQAVPGIADDLHGDTVEPTIVISAVNDENTYYQYLTAAGVTKTKFAESIRSTYNAHQDNDIEADFPVVLIDGDASVLKQYLNAATNGGFDSVRACNKVKVVIDRYLYDKNTKEFCKANEAQYPSTLVYHTATGEFTTTAQYDNQKDTFTLVTVTMTESATGATFVLHIPVIVRRMLQVDFMATMTSGTVFNKTDDFYKDTKNHALASQGENITGYLTFHYNSNASDTNNPASYNWQSYMEAGGDLLGYYQKTVDTGTTKLPAGTKITLIDCQNGDRRYYAEVGEGTKSKLELFNGGNLTFTASNGDAFTPPTLSDLLQIEAAKADDTATVKWVKLENGTGATVKDKDGNYYRLYNEKTDTEINEFYTLEVKNTSPQENYFVVISVPNAENHRLTLDKSGMKWSNSATSPPLEVHQVHRYDPTMTDPKEGNSEASFNYLDNYKQSLVDNISAGNVQVQTTSAKVEFPISVTNTVTFTPANYNDSDPLYQELVISLRKTEENAITSVGLPSDAVAVTNIDSSTTTENAVKLYAYYLDGSGQKQYYVRNGNSLVKSGTEKVSAVSYSWSASANSAEMVLPFAVKTDTGYQYIDLAGLRKASGGKFFLEAETTLEMSVVSVLSNNTIPYDSGESKNFTQVDATSILSFTESGLSYSTLKGNAEGNRKYYLNTARNAVLKLDYTNIDQLGINAREDKNAAIDTILTLDFSNMEGFASDIGNFQTLNEADTVKFTLSLKQKGETEGETEYQNVQIGNYMTGAAIPGGSENLTDYTITLRKNEDGSYPYYHEQTGQFTIPISFTVNMDANEYANYRIYADVELLKGNADQTLEVDGSGAYITYTFAKINVNGYWNQLTG